MNAVPAVRGVITVSDGEPHRVVGDDHVLDPDAGGVGSGLPPERGEPPGDPDALDDGEDDAPVAGVLIQLLPARGAFLLQPLQRRDHHRQELHDDRCRDVRHDPQPEDGHLVQRAAGEQVEQVHQPAARLLLLHELFIATRSTPGVLMNTPSR